MPVTAARAAAFDILLKVEQQDSYASELLHSEKLDSLSPSDRGLCMELVMGVLRWQSALDQTISKASSKPLAKMDVEVRLALRLAAYQMRFLERVPSRAAVNESVELVKRARKRSAVPFANAVLRKLAEIPWPKTELEAGASAKELAQALAHPQWVVERWMSEYGPLATARICSFDQKVPVTAIRVDSGEVERELVENGVELRAGELVRGARRVGAGDITKTKAFIEGRVAIQDEASQLIALLVGSGFRILDCCAAPGSKTAALALRNPQAQIVAAEIHPHRARLMRERIPNANIEILTASATELPFGAEFDRVLVDVPCSGTGTLARNPEIKWKLREEDLADLQGRQVAILKAALRHVAPGGKLVYSTCSLEPEENAAVVDAALASSEGFEVLAAENELSQLRDAGELAWTDIAALTRGQYLRTLPGVHPGEGFFAAVLQRKS